MGIRDWLRRIVNGEDPAPVAPRRERREAAREREHRGGEPWNEHDRHENRDGLRELEDVTPRTLGSGGSRLGRG
ncbi:MAG: hypothetical protein U0838_00070 [Chloroflexota bacterium]